MKIALVNDFSAGTGIGNYAFSLFSELQKKAEVEMFFLDSQNSVLEQQPGLQRINGIAFPVLRQVLNNALVFPARVPKGFDVYHASNQYISHIAVKEKASVVSCMDIISQRLQQDYNPIVRYFWNSSLAQIKKAKKIIAISEFTKRELQRNLQIEKEKIEVIHLGFDAGTFIPLNRGEARKELGLDVGKQIVLNVGSEEPRKNIPTLLRAFAELAKEKENVLLLRVGEQRPETRELIQKLGLQDKVKYFQGLPKEKLALAYNSADLLAFTSYYEGFGLPVLEAMACGTAIVAARATSSVQEITENAAVLVENPLDANEFKNAMADVLEKPVLKRKLEQKGFSRARNFSWKKNAEQTIKVYEEVLRP